MTAARLAGSRSATTQRAGQPLPPDIDTTVDKPLPTAYLFLSQSLFLQPFRDGGCLVGRRFFIFLDLPPRQYLEGFDQAQTNKHGREK